MLPPEIEETASVSKKTSNTPLATLQASVRDRLRVATSSETVANPSALSATTQTISRERVRSIQQREGRSDVGESQAKSTKISLIARDHTEIAIDSLRLECQSWSGSFAEQGKSRADRSWKLELDSGADTRRHVHDAVWEQRKSQGDRSGELELDSGACTRRSVSSTFWEQRKSRGDRSGELELDSGAYTRRSARSTVWEQRKS